MQAALEGFQLLLGLCDCIVLFVQHLVLDLEFLRNFVVLREQVQALQLLLSDLNLDVQRLRLLVLRDFKQQFLQNVPLAHIDVERGHVASLNFLVFLDGHPQRLNLLLDFDALWALVHLLELHVVTGGHFVEFSQTLLDFVELLQVSQQIVGYPLNLLRLMQRTGIFKALAVSDLLAELRYLVFYLRLLPGQRVHALLVDAHDIFGHL